ncbi:MAG TPA: phenylalanine--tRNA ligase subunit beta, partial [Casimicrobiaceae bacterium]|nr:phenylalanine--tRNA ligase subunit beta [Casimicrobiaceae bacterium]
QEVITFSFVSSAWEDALFPGRDARHAPIRVLNPIASQLDVMRTTLAGGLIEVLRTNLAQREERVRVFEVGRCFERTADGDRQPWRIGGLAYGESVAEQWGAAKRNVDLFDVKGDLQALVTPVSITTQASPHPALHPGRSAVVIAAGETVGWLGELHPRLVRHFELPRAPILFELDVAPLTEIALPHVKPVSKLPRVRRDLALVVDEGIPAQALLDALEAAKPAQVASLRLFDVYRGPSLGPGKKSVAILVVMQDTERTLTDADADVTMAALLDVAKSRFNATLRQ